MKTTLSFRVSCAAAVLAAPAFVSGCTPVGAVIGAGATAGVAATQERGLGGALSDTRISTEISDKWFRHDLEMWRKLSLSVHEGRVLITGAAAEPRWKIDAAKLAWEVAGVRDVANEVQINAADDLGTRATDTWISTQLRAKITFDRAVMAVNYTIDVLDGVVYLTGVGQSAAELDRVIDHARNLSHVKRVVSYVRLKSNAAPATGADRPAPDAPSSAAPMPPPPKPAKRNAVTVEKL